jgi:hypothetical protein
MYNIALTRFNNITWNELTLWKDNHNIFVSNQDGIINKSDFCIYNTPNKIKDSVKYNIPLFVIEMNNDENIIMGIGFIHNTIFNKKFNIYKSGNYNRYSYKGKCRIDRLLFNQREIVIIDILETLLFKGSRHSKRGHGITIIPNWILKNKYIDFIQVIKEMFITRNML